MDTLLEVVLWNAVAATAMAVGVSLLGRWMRRPTLLHGLWILVLLKLITPPVLAVPISWKAPERPAALSSSLSLESLGALPENDDSFDLEPALISTPPAPFTWKQGVLAFWAAGSFLVFGLLAWRLWRFQTLLRLARPADVADTALIEAIACKLGLARLPAASLVPASISPMVWNLFGRAQLLLPAEFWMSRTREEQEVLVTHELAHLKRGDHWVRRLELLVLLVYWWLPVFWWARRQLQQVEEECCDAWVIWALPAATSCYANALIETVAYLSQSRLACPPAATGIGHLVPLRRRLTMILSGKSPKSLSAIGWLTLGALGLLILPLAPTGASSELLAYDDEMGTQATSRPAAAPQARPKPGEPGAQPKYAVVGQAAPAPMAATTTRTPVPTADIEDLKAEIELLAVQQRGKEAELNEAQIVLEGARKKLQRMERINERGGLSSEDLDQGRLDLAVLEARLKGKAAQRDEVALRIKQARSRLQRMQTMQQRYPIPVEATWSVPATATRVPPDMPATQAAPTSIWSTQPLTPQPSASATMSPAPIKAVAPRAAISAATPSSAQPAPVAKTTPNKRTATTSSAEISRDRLGELQQQLEELQREVQRLRKQADRPPQ